MSYPSKMERNPAENDEVVSQFCAMTGTRPAEVYPFKLISCDA